MLVDEIGTYLAGAGLGLTLAAPSPNLFTTPFPLNAPEAAVCLVSLTGTVHGTFGVSLSAPAIADERWKVIVRDTRERAQAAQTLAQAIYKKLRRLGPVQLSGVQYHNVKAELPAFLNFDDNQRPMYHFDCEAWKDESA